MRLRSLSCAAHTLLAVGLAAAACSSSSVQAPTGEVSGKAEPGPGATAPEQPGAATGEAPPDLAEPVAPSADEPVGTRSAPTAASGARAPETASPAAHEIMAFADVWRKLTPPPDEWTACERDEECVGVEIGCCDHCNGGRLVAARRRYAEQTRERYRPSDCNRACTEKGCFAPAPVCEASRCTLRRLSW
jgi:hypothetical protein